LLGLKPVIVDPEPATFNISVEAVRKAITPKTKAIVPVHLFGQCAYMESIMELANKHDLLLSKMPLRRPALIISLKTEPPKSRNYRAHRHDILLPV